MCRDEGINVVKNAKITLVKGRSGESIRLLGARDGVSFSWVERICWSPEGARQIPAASALKKREWGRPTLVT